ncbi:MAG TPA: hypothetical protein VMC82_01260 [Thermoplasmata archaeon]|nr:hypothetical protein [Thermoplasmata archaeon]
MNALVPRTAVECATLSRTIPWEPAPSEREPARSRLIEWLVERRPVRSRPTEVP